MRHITLTCEHHPDLRWHCKAIAVSTAGRYTGARNIFFEGKEIQGKVYHYTEEEGYFHECPCPGSALIALPGQDLERDPYDGY